MLEEGSVDDTDVAVEQNVPERHSDVHPQKEEEDAGRPQRSGEERGDGRESAWDISTGVPANRKLRVPRHVPRRRVHVCGEAQTTAEPKPLHNPKTRTDAQRRRAMRKAERVAEQLRKNRQSVPRPSCSNPIPTLPPDTTARRRPVWQGSKGIRTHEYQLPNAQYRWLTDDKDTQLTTLLRQRYHVIFLQELQSWQTGNVAFNGYKTYKRVHTVARATGTVTQGGECNLDVQ